MNLIPDDGCSEDCQIEAGWSCSYKPSICNTICSDGLIAGVEQCDDNNTLSNDGCFECIVDDCWICKGEPSICEMKLEC